MYLFKNFKLHWGTRWNFRSMSFTIACSMVCFLSCWVSVSEAYYCTTLETLIAILVDVIPTIIIHYSVQTMEV